MASTFSNPRWDALACESMAGCSFADDLLSGGRVAQNHGTEVGGGTEFAGGGGAILDGSYIDWDIVTQPGSFSA